MCKKAINNIIYCKGKNKNKCFFNKTVITDKPPITLEIHTIGWLLKIINLSGNIGVFHPCFIPFQILLYYYISYLILYKFLSS